MSSNDDAFPLSPSQTEVWLSQSRWTHFPLQNNGYAFSIGSTVDPDRFFSAHDSLVKASDSLRCRLVFKNGKPLQIFPRDFSQSCEFHDLTACSSSELSLWIGKFAATLLNPEHSTWRSALIKTSGNDWLWIFLQHHLASDRWSFQLYLERLKSFYHDDELASKKPANFVETLTSKPASNFSIESASLPPLAQNRFYAGLQNPTLPTGTRNTSSGLQWYSHIQSLQTDERFKAFSPDLATLQILATALFTVLYRLHNRGQISFAVVFQNRRNQREKNTSGMLVELRPLTVRISPEDSFFSLHQKVRAALLETLSENRTAPVTPCDTVLNCITGAFGSFSDETIQAQWLYPGCHDPAHQLRLHYHDYNPGQAPELIFDTNNQSFPSDHSQRLANNFINTLAEFAAIPDQSIGTFSFLGSANENPAKIDPIIKTDPIGHSVIETFLAIAQSQPQASAIKDDLGNLSYHDLATSVLTLGSALEKPARGDVIALLIGHNRFSPLASLAVLSRGLVYLPLDPETPPLRLQEILLDAGVTTVLTTTDLVDRVPDGFQSLIIDSPNLPPLAEIPARIPENPCAYLLYTSGSTGKPNGVRVRHQSILQLLADMEKRVPTPTDTSVSWWTQSTFDVSVYEIFSALLFGRPLCIPSQQCRLTPRQFFSWLAGEQVTNTYLPPYYLEPFLNYLQQGNPYPPIRRMLVGVEPLDESLLANLTRQLPGLAIINGYGPTETTVCATFYQVDPEASESRRTPLGRPTAGNSIFLLDSNQQKVPPGAIGEIFISGEGLAQGYHNRPQLDKERFLPNPFSSIPDSRLYRTGDLARLRDDQQLEFVGRIDHQLKVNGLRIDPSEVERAANSFPGLSNTVAIKDSSSGAELLVLYYETSRPVSSSDLHRHLVGILPAAMIPRHLVELEKIPLNENGKIARDSALLRRPSSECQQRCSTALPEQPSNEVETIIAEIWQNTLKLESLGINQSFFQLGGTSIAAMETMQHICQTFDLDLPLQTLFKTPTIQALAKIVTTTIEDEIAVLTDEEAARLETQAS